MRPFFARTAPILAASALALASLCAVAALMAGPAYRLGWWPLALTFQVMQWAAITALGAAVLALIALVMAFAAPGHRGMRAGLFAIALSTAVAVPPIAMLRKAQRVPPIHDITTDTERPPQFVAVVPLRRGAPNAVEYQARTAALQRQGYPDLAPLVLKMPPPEALARAEQAARAMGWEIVAVSPQAGLIEATDTTWWFGFKDDVVVRVSAHPDGSRVDVRSLSRVGGSDLGVNAGRIRAYLRRVAAP